MTVRKACKDDMAAIMSIEKDAFAAQIQEKTETFAERMEVFGGAVFRNRLVSRSLKLLPSAEVF